METIADRVKKIIADQFGISTDDVKPEATFEDLRGDSLDHVEIIMELEEEFEIEIDDDDARTISTVQQAIDYVTAKVPA